MARLKKIKKYFFENINITVIPSPAQRMRTFKIKRITPLLIFVLIAATITVLSYLYNHYFDAYQVTTERLEELRGVRAENTRLKNELYKLAQDTEVLRQTLTQLQEYNREIKGMIDIDGKAEKESNEEYVLELKTYLGSEEVYPTGLPIGGGDINYAYYFSWQMIEKARDNIDIVRAELPQQEEELSALESSVKEYNALKAATPSIWPLADDGSAYISSNFGWRKDPFTGKQAIHEGLDIGTWYNTPVLATADGVVTYVGKNGSYGLMVTIEHGFGFETRYAHLNKAVVKKGQKVSRGDIIAYSGNSGRSSGPHLHYEVRKNNIPQDPREYIGR